MSKQNKPHKHSELIKLWADGAEIQYKNGGAGWISIGDPSWCDENEYRIKPEPKTDRVHFARLTSIDEHSVEFAWCFDIGDNCNTRVTFDGETGKLKSVEVL